MKNHSTLDPIKRDQIWRRRLRQGAKMMILAALLFAVTSRLEIRAQTSATSAQQTDAGVRFAYGGNAAQIPATYLGHLVFFPASVNGSRPLLFQVDSTAAVSSIDASRAADLGLTNLSGATLRLSGVEVTLPNFTQGAKENFAALIGRQYEGTLGKDFLEHFVVELDYGRQTAQLHDPTVFHYSGAGKAFPLRFVGPMPVVRAKFEVGGKTNEADFGVNAALDAPVRISQSYAGAHKLEPSHLRTFPSTDEPLDPKALAVRLKTFQIGPFLAVTPMGEIAATTMPGGDSKLAGEIGGGMLRRFIVIFDYAHQQMILEPNSTFPNDDPGDMSGISMVAKGPGLKTYQVISVAPGTPGADAKIQKGDVIAGVDADAAADMTLFQLRDLFSQVGHTYKLLVERNGQEIMVSITMRRLL
jgi:hypothetical protein